MPPKTNPATRTQALSTLLVLLQDLNFDELTTNESASERSARKRVVSAFINQELGKLESRIEAAEAAQNRTPSSVLNQYLDDLRRKLQVLLDHKAELIEKDAADIGLLTSSEEYLVELEVRLNQQEHFSPITPQISHG